MNKLFLTAILIVQAAWCVAQKVNIKSIELPEVVCAMDEHYKEYWIEGFDVDKEGNMYLMSCDSFTQQFLYVYDKGFHLKSKDTISGDYDWLFAGNKGLAFLKNVTKDPYVLCYDGKEWKTPLHSIPSMLYSPESETLSLKGPIYRTSKGRPVRLECSVSFSLKEWRDVTRSRYVFNLSEPFFRLLNAKSCREYKGRYQGKHVLCDVYPTDNERTYNILYADDSGKIISSVSVHEKELFSDVICTPFGCNIEILRILRNGKMYFLGANKKKNRLVLGIVELP